MNWIHNFQLFLFDFDGLLINSEELHFLAYKRMCADRGVTLDWDFNYYCSIAHYSSEGLRDRLYQQYPSLYTQEPSWPVLYNEKKQAIFQLLEEGGAHPMPGVEKLLLSLQKANIKRCVVTHSPEALISIVRRKCPIFNTIPNWITREHYNEAKPNPECYLKAIEFFADPSDRLIGFEDTPRGMNALIDAFASAPAALPVMIAETDYPEIPSLLSRGALRFRSFEDISIEDFNEK
jgi:HAD superfamily hydrolase (TIGR01509 family)